MRTIRQCVLAFCEAALIGVGVLLVGPADLGAQTKPKDAARKRKTTATTKSGACLSRGGVETWYADSMGDKSATEATKDAGKATANATKKAPTPSPERRR
jgi:hypothetical protein